MSRSIHIKGRMGKYFGTTVYLTDYSLSPGELALALEQRGFELLWASEHSHLPVTGSPMYSGHDDLPKLVSEVMDLFMTLTVAAMAAKTRARGGAGVRRPSPDIRDCTVVDRPGNGTPFGARVP